MVYVYPYRTGYQYKTEVWISAAARKGLDKYIKKNHKFGGQLVKTIERYAETSFQIWENKGILRTEGQSVWAIGRSDLFRLLGGYGDSKAEFLILDARNKPGQSRGKRINDSVDDIARILAQPDWKKATHETIGGTDTQKAP